MKEISIPTKLDNLKNSNVDNEEPSDKTNFKEGKN